MSLKAHIDALNSYCDGAGALFSRFRLDEDSVHFKVNAGAATGTVSICLHERSSYPRTGALAFAEGSDALEATVQEVADAIGESASLDKVVRLVGNKLPDGPSGMGALLAGLPAPVAKAAPAPAAAGDDDESDDAMDEGSEAEDDDEDEDDNQLDHDFEKGAELENKLLRLRHQWELKDQKRRSALEEENEAERAREEMEKAALPQPGRPHLKKPDKAQQQKRGAHQIFSSAEATRMLCNELFEMMKEEAEGFDGVSAQCIDSDIHLWRVQIRDLDPASPIAADMKRVQELHGYDTLQLELQFTPDMHPFYPAFVKVLRPRFEDVSAEAAMGHPVMTLEGWDPMKPVKWLIRFVQQFLEKHARIAVDDERNDPKLHPDGAYTSAEHGLCRLEILSSTRPQWSVTHPKLFASRQADVDLDRIRTLNFGKKKAATGAGKGGWEAGVGYGHGSTDGPSWDISATEKAQAQKDREMRQLLAQVTECVDAGQLRPEVLTHSCVRNLMWEQLANGSLLDVGSRPERTSKYTNMLALLTALGRIPQLREVVAQPIAQSDGSGGRSVLEALEAVRRQADFFVQSASLASEAASSSSGINLSAVAALEREEPGDTLGLAMRILECAKAVGKAPARAEQPPATPSSSGAAASGTPAAGSSRATRTTRAKSAKAAASADKPAEEAPAPAAAASTDAEYIKQMQEIQFEAVGAVPGHHYESRDGGKEAGALHLPARTKRLALEAADMMGGALPCAVSSTIWARVDEKRMHVWRAIISGPEDTPYSGGLFVFDIMCPAEYPNVAPKVNLQTTGGGAVRFNPNLYHCGKVCLSLLGTWQGDQGESWHPKTSTLLQVLMSIQALILVPDPYFNEPGYERTRGTPTGDKQSRMYNEALREGTIKHAMLDQLKKPPAELRDAVLTHFRLRKTVLLAQCQAWRDDKENSPTHTTRLKALCTELEAALEAVPMA